jgi:hypothetical protein
MQEAATETLIGKNPQDAKRWTALVENAALPDVYYLPEYACATAEIEQTEAKALIAGPSSGRILAPLLVRRMGATANGSSMEWVDAASPYGYGGMLSLSTSAVADAAALRRFFEQLHDWCSRQSIVCCVLRLHPLTEQHKWFSPSECWENIQQIRSGRFASSIDCDDWDEKSDLPKHMNHGRHEDIRLAQRALHATWSTGDDQEIEASLNIFAGLYNELLNRSSAADFYRFPPSYYSGLTELGKRMGVVIAWCGDEPVGANIALAGRRYAYGHLSGTNLSGRKHGASTLLNIEEARWARKQGCRLLYLGGGMQPGDGIEKYKSSFGGPSHSYCYLTYIVDRSKFEHIRGLPNAPWPYNLPTTSSHADRPES